MKMERTINNSFGKNLSKMEENKKYCFFNKEQFRKLQSFALPVSRRRDGIIPFQQGDSDVYQVLSVLTGSGSSLVQVAVTVVDGTSVLRTAHKIR